MPSNNPPEIITLGSIGRPHGLKGWMRLNSYTDPSENILAYTKLFIQKHGEWAPFEMSAYEIRHSDILIKIADCDTPETARLYTNLALGTMKDALPKLAKGEYYWSDLEGLTVVNKEGIILGQVDHLSNTGANDIIVVRGKEKEHLLPYIKDFILSIDLEKKEMLVDWDPDF